ncbi:retrovirus-related pol polyprotein from transposon TNT 1-94 [Tanacetum coccineum]
MTRSSMNELFMPFKDPKREFRSSRKLFKTLSLDESRSPDFNVFTDQEEYSEEEVAETMAETKDGSDHEDANEHIEKVLKIVDLFHIPDITQDQVMFRAFHMSLTGAASRWLKDKPSGSITTWEDLKTKFLSKYFPPARTAKKMEEINNF